MANINPSASGGSLTRQLSPAVAAKAWTGSAVVFVVVTGLMTMAQSVLDARLIDALPPLISGGIYALAPTILSFVSVWLKKNKPA